MKIKETHWVPHLNHTIRLSEYAVGIFTTVATKAAIKKAIKKGLLLVNNQRGISGQFITGGENIVLLEDETLAKKNIKLDLEVLWEDAYLAVIYKPAGILVSGNKAKTISNALVHNLQPSSLKDAVQPQPVHRLDFATSGLLLIGKTASSIQKLGLLFSNKTIKKTYTAITIGNMPSSGVITQPIDAKESVSCYRILQSVPSSKFAILNLVELQPVTGRRHQLRIHCAHQGNPILGDATYGKERQTLTGKGLFLHASKIEFTHPFTQRTLAIERKVPKKFSSFFKT